MEREVIEREYFRLAKVADQRLRALEKYEHLENFKVATKWAYATAQRDIKSWGGINRFGTGKNAIKDLTDSEIEMKIADINKFLHSNSSTKKGITKVFVDRTNTFNKKYGTNVTWQEFANFVRSDTFEKLDSMYGSKTIMEVFHKTRDLSKEDAQKMIDSANSKFAPLEKEVIENLIEGGWIDNGKNNSTK